ncbi:MAG TPA: IclR family transcriptional regulator [Luteitalea sp.]|nr:IclR family transcriptional regulator [Luteitalea sp.]
MRATKTPSVPALQRGLAILERIARSRRGLTFAQLTRYFEDVPKSSVHTLVLTLEREGYLQREDATGRYVTGSKLVHIAGVTLDSVVLRERATPLLRALVADTRMTAHLAVLERDEVTIVAKVDRPGTHRIATWVGKRMDAHCTSLGKCLIAHIPEEDVDRLIADRGLLRHNEYTIVSPARLKQELTRVRTLGYALDDQEEELGGRCVGAPVWNRDGRIVAAVSISGNTDRITADTLDDFVRRVRQTAEAISSELGYGGDRAVATDSLAS